MTRGKYRLEGFDYRANRWYFVTVVTARRAHLFGTIEGTELQPSPLGTIVKEEIAALPERRTGVRVAVSAELPNHVHLLLGQELNPPEYRHAEAKFEPPKANSLGAIVGTLKAGITRRARLSGCFRGDELFQRRYHDRVVRDTAEWEVIADYIPWNPVNWHLDPLSGSREPTDEEIRDWKRRIGL